MVMLMVAASDLLDQAAAILTAPGCNKFVHLSAKAAMLDLLQCLETSTNKSAKRVQRLMLLAKAYPTAVSANMDRRFQQYQQQLIDTQDDDQPVQALTLTQLIASLRKPDIEDGEVDIKFPKLDPTVPFTQRPKQVFHDALKVIVNKDGQVYNIFSAVAVVAFNRLSMALPMTMLRTLLLAHCKLVFKGGASIGKFLFQGNPKVWNSLSSEEKAVIFNTFNKGGDNDTGLKFERVVLPGLSDEAQNNEIASIIYDLMIVVKQVIAEFHVEALIKEYLVEPTYHMHKIDGSYFSVVQRMAKGFTIVEQNANEMVLVSSDEEAYSSLFSTVTKVSFQSLDHVGNAKMTQFYLGRIKASYKFKLQERFDLSAENVGEEFNAYAECLDISASLIGSYSAFDDRFGELPDDDGVKYQRIRSV
jgi:hypothetical protein